MATTEDNEQQQQKKRIAAIARVATIANLIPRDIFESEESWLKEIDKVMSYKGMSDADIKEAYKARRVVHQAQHKRVPKVMSASVYSKNFEVPDLGNWQQISIHDSREERKSELTDFLSMFEGIH